MAKVLTSPSARTERPLESPTEPFQAGVDEAGRGPLAGPVVAAAVILPVGCRIEGLDDSKKLSESQREQLVSIIQSQSMAYGIGISDASEIDAINILEATFLAMRRAVLALSIQPRSLVVDGNRLFSLNGLTTAAASPTPSESAPLSARAIIGGDGKVLSIAAASVLAKTTRDRMMVDWDRHYPRYGFKKHKGYGSAAHLDAIEKWGPTPIHRFSFKPLKK
jgi:ribonuclease HII